MSRLYNKQKVIHEGDNRTFGGQQLFPFTKKVTNRNGGQNNKDFGMLNIIPSGDHPIGIPTLVNQ